uniref:Replication-associated protein n=1 Tax=Tarsiger cyanurus Genomoviridae sp. TaxID=2814994 RepID=A0A8E7G1P9_9VIRU
MPRPFLLKDAKYALLTYAQVPESETAGFADAFTTLATLVPAEFTLARELHDDGGTHYHAFLDFGRKRSFRDTGRFDCCGRHPNIERVGRTPRRAWEYVTKDGDIIAGNCEAPPEDLGTQGHTGEGEHSSDWARIVQSETRDEFFELIRLHQPRALVCSFMAIAKYADWQYRAIPEPYQHPENWEFRLDSYPILLEWVETQLLAGLERNNFRSKAFTGIPS